MSKEGRSRAAAARKEAREQQERREKTVKIVGVLTVAVVLIGIVLVAVLARSSASTGADPVVDASAPMPQGALPAGDPLEFGIPVGPEGAPVLEVWEDFQCPACKTVEGLNGDQIVELAESGKVRLVWRVATFLDRMNAGKGAAVASSSTRAAAAFGCAVDQGKAVEFHKTVFANQPVTEGDGYTDEQLLEFGRSTGMDAAAFGEFSTCVADGRYMSWAASSGATFNAAGHPGTPFALFDGTEVPNEVLADKHGLLQLVQAKEASSVQ